MKTPRQVELAIQIVMVAFAEKIRISKVSIPTGTHSLRVGLSLIAYGYPLEVCLGGFFHDVIEDTKIGDAFIKSLFGDRVDFLMRACTIDPKIGDTPEGEQELYDRVVGLANAGDVDPLRIKCSDSLDNLRTNYCLKQEWQESAVNRGTMWLNAANDWLPDERLGQELREMVRMEKVRVFPV